MIYFVLSIMLILFNSLSLYAIEPVALDVLNTSSAQELARQLDQERRAAARLTEFYSPHFSVSGQDDTELVVLNRTSDPLPFDVAALSPAGDLLPLGRFEVQPQTHFAVSIKELIRGAGSRAFVAGSLRVSILGDVEALQAWVLLSQGEQITEIPLRAPTPSSTQEAFAFWDTLSIDEVGPELFLVNAGNEPLTVTIEEHSSGQASLPVHHHRSLEVGEQWRVSPHSRRGWLKLSHTGDPGVLIAAGLLLGRHYLSALPVVASQDLGQDLAFHAVRVPIDVGVRQRAEPHLTLWNSSPEPQPVRVEILQQGNGSVLASTSLLLHGEEVRTIRLDELPLPEVRAARVRVAAARKGLAVSGAAVLPSQEVVDLAFFPEGHEHTGGMYPLPASTTHQVFTTLVNLGQEDATLVAQLSWAGGSYALGPLVVPAGASYQLDLDHLLALQQPDLLGRRLDPLYRQGFLHWRVQAGSRSLIARTEARPRDGRDSAGFNCTANCCYELPTGSIMPSFVSFYPGQTVSFQACVTYQTCTGIEGPWSTTPSFISSPAPFSWNGAQVSASGVADVDLAFESEEPYIGPSCSQVLRPVNGIGRGTTCKTHLLKSHKPGSWEATLKCTTQVNGEPASQRCALCNTCCNQIFNYKICSKHGLISATSDKQTCLGHCAEEMCS